MNLSTNQFGLRWLSFFVIVAVMFAFIQTNVGVSAQATVDPAVCLAVDPDGDGNVSEEDVDAAVTLAAATDPIFAQQIEENRSAVIGGGCAAPVDGTVGTTVGTTDGTTVGTTVGTATGTTAGTTDSTVGELVGSTTGTTEGSTGTTTGATDGTTGTTTGTATGTTDGTTGTTTGTTAGATGTTSGTTDGTTGTTAGTTGTSAGSTGSTAGTTGSSVAQVTGLPSTGSGNSMSNMAWPMVAFGSVMLMLGGHFVLSTIKRRAN